MSVAAILDRAREKGLLEDFSEQPPSPPAPQTKGLAGIGDSISSAPPSSPIRPRTKPPTPNTPESQTIQVFNPNTPDIKILSPVRKEAVLRSPAVYHDASHFDGPLKSKTRKSLRGKRVNSLILASPQKDIARLKKREFPPDQCGVMRVPTDHGEDRVYGMHPENNPDGTNRVIPVKGPGIYPLPGPVLVDLHDKYTALSASPSPTFGDYVKDKVRKLVEAESERKRPKSRRGLSVPSPATAPPQIEPASNARPFRLQRLIARKTAGMLFTNSPIRGPFFKSVSRQQRPCLE